MYSIFTYDYTGFDDFRFRLTVEDPATGEVIASYQQGAWGSGTALKTSGWKYAELDLSDHMGETVRLFVNAGGTADNLYAFWAYLDSAETGPPPVVAPLGEASSTTGSVMTDPQSGQVTIGMPSGNKSDITITSPIACPGGGTPSLVQLNLNGQLFTMSPTSTPGTYGSTIPAAQVQTGTLSIQVTCSSGNFVNTIGFIQLYDPSGIVTDAVTGDPVEGANVTLYKVPGWSPGSGGAGASQCQNNGPPWTQPAPTGLGVEVSPYGSEPNGGNPEIEPDVNPFVTNAIGYYGWDVAQGCWYVVVSKDGYDTLTSSRGGCSARGHDPRPATGARRPE